MRIIVLTGYIGCFPCGLLYLMDRQVAFREDYCTYWIDRLRSVRIIVLTGYIGCFPCGQLYLMDRQVAFHEDYCT